MLLTGKAAVISGAVSPHGSGLKRPGCSRGTAHAWPSSISTPMLRAVPRTASDKTACTAVAEEVTGAFGRIDILCNNAGVTQPVKTLDIGPGDWDRVLYCMSSASAQRGGGIFGGPH